MIHRHRQKERDRKRDSRISDRQTDRMKETDTEMIHRKKDTGRERQRQDHRVRDRQT